MKILFLSRWFPYPADNGARQRVFNLIKQLSTRHEVSLVSFAEQSPDCDALRQWCVNVQTAPYRTFDPAQNNSLAAFLSPVPRAYIATHSLELQALAENQATRFSPDVVIASQIDMAPYGIVVEAKARIFEEVEVSVIRDAAMHASQITKRVRARLTWAKTAHYLRGLLGNYTGCTVVSEAGKEQCSGNCICQYAHQRCAEWRGCGRMQAHTRDTRTRYPCLQRCADVSRKLRCD